jgi:acetolactate synthase I/II/III large subunit
MDLDRQGPRGVAQGSQSAAAAIIAALERLGVRQSFGIVGGGNAPLAEALDASSIRVFHFRHEAGAAFAAAEASIVSEQPAVVFVTLGPGLTNAITGIVAARSEGARVILFSGLSATATRGKFALQETTPQALPADLFTPGALFDYAETVESTAQLPVVFSRIAEGLARPGGFVAHVSIPAAITAARSGDIDFQPPIVSYPSVSPGMLETVTKLLAAEPFVIWTGFGARHAAAEVTELAELTGAPVMATPRGKGALPESHPLYLGVTGMGGHAGPLAYIAERRPAHALVLGSRLGEFTTFWDSSLLPQKAIIQVDLDRNVFGRAYPGCTTIGVHAEVRGFLRDLLRRLRARGGLTRASAPRPFERPPLAHPPSALVRSAALLAAMQRRIVESSDALVLTEPGAAFSWGGHSLFFDDGRRYRSTMAWASMGHTAAGVVGAAVASSKPAVSLVGDGALLMNNEISTAVRYGARAIWIVLNNGEYGMVRHGMNALRLRPVETEIPRVDFAMLARSMGCDGERVAEERHLEAALDRALAAPGPYVIDVWIDPDELPPYMRRMTSLLDQGVRGGAH